MDRSAPMGRVLAALFAAGLAGCNGGTGLMLSFADIVVEAPARNVDILIFNGDKTCDTLLSSLHQALGTDPSVKKHVQRNYPLKASDADILAGVQTDRPITLDVQVLDSAGLQIARACQTVTLATSGNPITLPARTLPVCQSLPTKLDIQLVIDTSSEWSLVDAEHFHLQDFNTIVLDPTAVLPGTQWGIVTYGNKINESPVNELLTPTTDLDKLKMTIGTLTDVQSGDTRMFDGLTMGAALSRARAVCGTYSVVMALAGGPERQSTRRFEDAQIGFVATPGDVSDDLYLYGIAFTTPGYTDLDAVLPMGGHGTVTGAGSRAQWQDAFREARSSLVALVQPKN